ncbi:MAG TPA: sigma factor-like helix-turn-helix DNA-binding protein [Acidimicrobiia bacterium]|nr:sigma factor-like helix-turn-helix DNA-binding protein [Acidimicrobiia bacterium]
MQTQSGRIAADAFSAFVREKEPVLRRALVATLGQERGREAAAEAFAYAWQHWDRVGSMAHPIAYLFRVGRSRTRYRRRERPVFDAVPSQELPHVEPGLPRALGRLSEKQRLAVVLVHAFGVSRREAAQVMGTRPSTVDTHLARGLRKLRSELGVDDDD